jgi:hypothetical protein
MQSITTIGTTDKINEELSNYCSDKYAGGTTGAANLRWLKDQNFEFIRFESGHWCNTAKFEAPVADSESFGYFLKMLKKLKDYPLFDDAYLSEIHDELSGEEWEQLMEEHKLEADTMWQVAYDNECYWEDDGMADNYGMHATFDIEAFVLEVRQKSQTWEAHYNSGEFHQPEFCGYCADSLTGDEARV